MPEQTRGLGTLIRYLGFKSTKIPVEYAIRAERRSSYSLHKLLELQWWKWPIEKIKQNFLLFGEKPTKELLKKLENQ